MTWGFAGIPGAEACEVVAGGGWGVWGESGGREREKGVRGREGKRA